MTIHNFDATYDVNDIKVGDTIISCGEYTVRYVMPYEQFFVSHYYKKPERPMPVIVVEYEGGGFQVVSEGDWEGCSPQMDSVIDALAADVMRTEQIDKQRR